MLTDDFLPVYDVSDSVSITVDADIATTWDALMSVDLVDVGRKRPLVAALGTLRMLPDVLSHWLHGEALPPQPEALHLRDLASTQVGNGKWVLLGQRTRDELAFGLIGKFWLPVIAFADVSSAEAFRDFAELGYAKTIYSLSVRRVSDERTQISGVMRTATTDARARQWFFRYWTLGVGAGAHVLVNGLLEVARDIAEKQARQVPVRA